ncbi:MAG: hypothetical protein PVG03_15785 [Desulfarculaceae bacterium]|jgi:hypothetical protein
MLYLHPIWQVAATLAAAWALWLGLARLGSLHLGRKAVFRRRWHILAGKAALAGWILGVLGGIAMARLTWHGFFITGAHAYVGLGMLPLMLFGLLSGLYMEKKPALRKVLPLLHGLNNAALLLLALYQFYLGDQVLDQFLSL